MAFPRRASVLLVVPLVALAAACLPAPPPSAPEVQAPPPVTPAPTTAAPTTAAPTTTTSSTTTTTVPVAARLAEISTGDLFGCGRYDDGTVRCWGSIVIDGVVHKHAEALAVAGITTARAVAAGGYHACILLADATVRCWGFNQSGQVGDGSTTLRFLPEEVDGLTGAVAVSAGMEHSCAVLEDGLAWCWGENRSGQLGDGTTTSSSVPVQVEGLEGAVGITAGNEHTCAVLDDSTVRCWGDNTDGRLGDGSTDSSATPVGVVGLFGAVSVSAGYAGTCAAMSDGGARCWGGAVIPSTEGPEIGETASLLPVDIGFSGVTTIDVGMIEVCASFEDGTAACFGMNDRGASGNGTTTPSWLPESPLGLDRVVQVSIGRISCARELDGEVWCWGIDTANPAPDVFVDSAVPLLVPGLS